MSPSSFLQRPARWLEAITRFRAKHTTAPNFAYELCASKVTDNDKRHIDLSSLRCAVTGAEPVQAETLDRFCRAFSVCGFTPESFCPSYGLAEATLLVTGGRSALRLREKRLSRQAIGENRVVNASGDCADEVRVVGCGLPIEEHDIKIVDAQSGSEAIEGRIGEIWFRGPAVADRLLAAACRNSANLWRTP
jgi:acyl-CoA synthetase (AMP-forming)/AMP-acid ligase II